MAPGGYAWWYLDLVSADGHHGLTLILFVGSVFSPWYARARAADPDADPFQHCAVNICLYGPQRRWVMSERPAQAVHPDRQPDRWTLGGTQIRWQEGELVVRFDERTSPLGRVLRGQVRLRPELGLYAPLELDPAGRHHWWPVAPRCRAAVELEEPALSFEGHGYHDSNWGSEPLEAAFSRWTWCRAATGSGVAMLYDTRTLDGEEQRRGIMVEPEGLRNIEPAATVDLPRTGWRVFRQTRSDRAGDARVQRTLEDTPFYNRSLVETTLDGQSVLAVHEALDLERFTRGWVQWMLPFKSRRSAS